MTDKEKKNKIADILLDFYDDYHSNEINRPMIPFIYAGKILDSLQEEPKQKIKVGDRIKFKGVYDEDIVRTITDIQKYDDGSCRYIFADGSLHSVGNNEIEPPVKWAYIDELLPENKEVEKSTTDDCFTSDKNRSFIRWSIDKMLSDEFNRKWKYNEYNESSIKLIRLGAFDGYHQAIIDILTFIHTNMSDEELHNPLVWKSCMFINYFGKWAPMLELCNKLNTLLFEKTEENEKKIKQLIRENITEHPGRKIFYDENLYSEDKSLEAVIRKKSMFFVPTEDQKFSPGIIVKYRKKKDV